jgi:hypothetical protein
MPSRISYNIHAQRLSNHDHLINHLRKIQPAAVLVMDGLGLAQEIKGLLPDTLVINRIFPDDDIHHRVSPEDWLNQRASQAEGGIAQYTTNEAGFGQELINWHVRLMELAAPRRVPLVIGNMSVGTPQREEWANARRMLELLDQHRDLFVLGLHEYACGVVTSGFLGGYPNNAGVPPNSGQQGRDLIPTGNWPGRDEAGGMTMFHLGRFKFLLQACNDLGIRPPRIVLTEHGFDDVSDIKPWSETLLSTGSYLNIRGWKSAQNQWTGWYGGQGWSPQRAMYEQLTYADRTIYQGSPVEAQLIFCWGHSSDMWDQFDVADAAEFHSLLENYAQQPLTAEAFQAASFAPPQPTTAGGSQAGAMPVGVQPIGVQPTVMPIGVQPVGVQPVGVASETAPVGVQPVGVQPGFAPVGVQPVGVVPGVNAKPGAVTHLDELLTNDDLNTLIIGLQAASSSGMFSDEMIASFARLEEVLERFRAGRTG